MEFRIRPAGLEDLPHLLHHRQAMFVEMGFRERAVLSMVERASREYFTEALLAGRYRAWLAEDTTTRVLGGGGIVIADWPGYPGEKQAKRPWILNMYTEPSARGCGIAKRLMKVMIEWCQEEGFCTVSLHASPAGRPIYESLGFQPTTEMSLRLC